MPDSTPHAREVAIPEVIARYLGARDRHETDAALGAFALDAMVTDEGDDYEGVDAIRGWLDTAAREYTYTRTLVDVTDLGDGRWLVANRLEGDFPGGVADLRYRFRLVGEQIAELVIAP